MDKQVLSIEQMQELEKLGIDTTKASMCWNTYDSFLIANNSDLKNAFNYSDDDWVPTFTLQDILEMLPKMIHNEFLELIISVEYYICRYKNVCNLGGDNPLEAAFNMLIWCKQNNYI